MMPGIPDTFWSHVPSWAWPVIVAAVISFFVLQAIKASEGAAKAFGRVGEWIHRRAAERDLARASHRSGVDVGMLQEEMLRVLALMERMEANLDKSTDDLECAISYLVEDAQWHHQVDILFAEHFPHDVLPARMPFSAFSSRWRGGWRPVDLKGDDAW